MWFWRATFWYVFLSFLSTSLFANFKFIELDYGHLNVETSKRMFRTIKKEVESRTSVKIDNDFYRTISLSDFEKGKMPEVPYLWLFGCENSFRVSDEFINSARQFVDRGGILFVDSCGAARGFSFSYGAEHIGLSLAPRRKLKILNNFHLQQMEVLVPK